MKVWSTLTASALLLAAIGCGGGGGGKSSGGTPTGGSSSLRLFATDNLAVGFDHVWVSVQKVELIGDAGATLVFDDAAGRVIDLKSLRDATGRRFTLLCNRNVPSGNYNGIRVTVAESATVFPAGAATGTATTFETSTAGSKVMSLAFSAPRPVTPNSNLIVDFDLANWDLTGTTLSATGGRYLAVVDDSSVRDVSRHEADDYKGLLGNLGGSPPAQTFTLSQGTSTVNVRTDANTAIFNGTGAVSPSLANGVRVEVTGAFSSADNAILATSIKIENETENHAAELRGAVTSFAADSNSISVDAQESEGFLPESSSYTVQYADDIRFFGSRGVALTVAEFEALLPTTSFLKAEGSVSGNVFTATKLKVEDRGRHGEGGEGHHTGQAEISGALSAPDATAGTFKVAASEWEGLNIASGSSVNVATTAATEYKLNGNHVDAATFFAGLTGTVSVKVEGTYDATTQILTATDVKVGSGGGGGGNGGGSGGGGDDGSNHG